MCLSNVFEKKGLSENIILSNIQRFTVDGDSVLFTDLLERETRIQGKLVSADLVNGKVIINTGA